MELVQATTMNVAIVIPVFNERENLPALLDAIRLELKGKVEFTFVIADDGSTDGTKEWLKEEQAKGNVFVVENEHNAGPGKAFEAGFRCVLSQLPQSTNVLTLEGDGTADLGSIHQLLEAINTADVALASVYSKGGGFSRTSMLRLAISKMANGLTRWKLKLPYRTLTSFYRLYSIRAIRALAQRPIMIEESGFICQVEILHYLHQMGLRIVEVPTVLYTDRRKGASKMKLMKTMLAHLRFLQRTKV